MYKRGEAPLSINSPSPCQGEGDTGDGVVTKSEWYSLFTHPCINSIDSINLFLIPHHLQKLLKYIDVVQGAGGGFGVVLDGEDG